MTSVWNVQLARPICGCHFVSHSSQRNIPQRNNETPTLNRAQHPPQRTMSTTSTHISNARSRGRQKSHVRLQFLIVHNQMPRVVSRFVHKFVRQRVIGRQRAHDGDDVGSRWLRAMSPQSIPTRELPRSLPMVASCAGAHTLPLELGTVGIAPSPSTGVSVTGATPSESRRGDRGEGTPVPSSADVAVGEWKPTPPTHVAAAASVSQSHAVAHAAAAAVSADCTSSSIVRGSSSG